MGRVVIDFKRRPDMHETETSPVLAMGRCRCDDRALVMASEFTKMDAPMVAEVVLVKAEPADGLGIAEIHLAARRAALPDLPRPFTDAETRAWFASTVGDGPDGWWVARSAGQIVGYMQLVGAELEQLYVLPAWQGRGIGTALLNAAKARSPNGLSLWTFQQNAKARSFYERHGFQPVGYTDGCNDEREPDVQVRVAAGNLVAALRCAEAADATLDFCNVLRPESRRVGQSAGVGDDLHLLPHLHGHSGRRGLPCRSDPARRSVLELTMSRRSGNDRIRISSPGCSPG